MNTEKEITIYDIARALNISIATVSRALKDDPVVHKKTKKRIIETAESMGYRSNNFARSLRQKNTNTIGVIIPKINSYFMSAVISGMESVANTEGYNLIISQSSELAENEIKNAKAMFNNRVDGLLVSLAYNTQNLDHFQPFIKKNVPVIFFDRVADDKNSLSIRIDNRGAAYEITKHLIEQGCKRIAHITASQQRNVYAERLQGFKEALSDHKVRLHQELIFVTNLGMEDGASVANSILKMKTLPDGVFVANDNCAVGLMKSLKKAGIKIPEDMAVAGFNDDPVSIVIEPNLTTIHYPGFEMGVIAARNLVNYLKNRENIFSANSIIMKSEMIIRESSLRKNAG